MMSKAMISLDNFTTFANTALQGPSGEKSTISVGQDGKLLNAGRWYRLGTRTAEFKAHNLEVRTHFYEAVCKTFGGREKIPDSVMAVLKLNDFGLDGDGKVTSNRPLTARRILAVTEAIRQTAPEAIASGLATPGNRGAIARMAPVESKIIKATGFASVEEMKAHVANKIETFYRTAQQVRWADVESNSAQTYARTITGMGALVDIMNARLDSIDQNLCRGLFDKMLDCVMIGKFANAADRVDTKGKMASILHCQLDMIDEAKSDLNDGFVNEFERLMKAVTPEYENTFEGIAEAYDKMLDLMASTGEGGISNYAVARFQDMLVRPALIQCNPNNRSYTITIDDLAKNTPFASSDNLAKWLKAGLGEDATTINFMTGVGSLANDLPRGVNGDFFFTIGSGEEAIKVDGKVTRNQGQQTVDECLQVSKNVLNAIKTKFPNSTKEQQNIVMQALSQNSLMWARTFLFPGAEHAAGDFTIEEVPGSSDIKVGFKAKEIKGAGIVQDYSHAYLIHTDGTGEMVEFERSKAIEPDSEA